MQLFNIKVAQTASAFSHRLAVRLAEIPGWVEPTIQQDSLGLAPLGAPPMQSPKADSRLEILALFDRNVAAARTAIAGTKDEHFGKPWTLLAGGKTIFSMPRIAVLRTFVMNHSIHHRAQLGVFLRLNNLPLPAIYGPSADEGQM